MLNVNSPDNEAELVGWRVQPQQCGPSRGYGIDVMFSCYRAYGNAVQANVLISLSGPRWAIVLGLLAAVLQICTSIQVCLSTAAVQGSS